MIYQPPMAAVVIGEAAQLQQVLLNLCRNAAHAMPEGGTIELTIDVQEIDETRALSPRALRLHGVSLNRLDNAVERHAQQAGSAPSPCAADGKDRGLHQRHRA